MAVREWHPVKIVLMWAGVWLLFFIFRSVSKTGWPNDRGIAKMESGYFVIWLLLVIIVSALTWKWLSAREKPRE